jgi:hypothetical protein
MMPPTSIGFPMRMTANQSNQSIKRPSKTQAHDLFAWTIKKRDRLPG